MSGRTKRAARDDSEAPVSVRVLVGAGGRGKKRLARKPARQIAKDGWLAALVTADELARFRRDGGTDMLMERSRR
jgi:hypothetical protein